MKLTPREKRRHAAGREKTRSLVAVELRSVTDIGWDQAPHWEKKKKNRRAKRTKR